MKEGILAIETSCDETSAAIVLESGKVLANVVASQLSEHRTYGGVVPELAARRHLETIVPVVDRALQDAGCQPQDLAAVAVTKGPGLIGALLIGVQAAKSLAFAWEKPLIGVHHLAGHVAANWLETDDPPHYPAVCLVVSGGHTHLYLLHEPGRLSLLGRTRDDAVGEAFDKVARLLQLGYPGGPIIDQLAREGRPDAHSFPRSMSQEATLDFSFSGLKTAVSRQIPDGTRLERQAQADLAASFQAAVLDMLSLRIWQAVEKYRVTQVLLAGGVAANSHLRERLSREAAERGVRLHIPDLAYCTDNAAMIAAAAWPLYRSGRFSSLDLDAEPRLPLEEAGL